MKKKNLILYYPSFERGDVEENLKNLINNFNTNLNIHKITLLLKQKVNKIFKRKLKIYQIKKSKIYYVSKHYNSIL